MTRYFIRWALKYPLGQCIIGAIVVLIGVLALFSSISNTASKDFLVGLLFSLFLIALGGFSAIIGFRNMQTSRADKAVSLRQSQPSIPWQPPQSPYAQSQPYYGQAHQQPPSNQPQQPTPYGQPYQQPYYGQPQPQSPYGQPQQPTPYGQSPRS